MSQHMSRNGFAATFPRIRAEAKRPGGHTVQRRARFNRGRVQYTPSFFIAIGVTVLSSMAFIGFLALALGAG